MSADEAIRAALDAQVAAWNRGDLHGFMAACTDDVAYVTGDGVLRGRQAVLDQYAARYQDSGAMPPLALTLVDVRAHEDTAVAVVRWAVPTKGGHALLAFEHRDGRWLLAWDATIVGR